MATASVATTGWGGAIVSFVVTGGDRRGSALMRALTLATEATSLGGVEPAVRRVLAEPRHDLLPVGVGGPKARVGLDRRAARHVSSGQCRRLLVHRRLA